MPQPVIYLDKSLVLNFAMDFVILALTATLSGYKAGLGRLALGASLGSLYILAIFLPNLSFVYNMAVKLLYSGLIIAAAFYPLTWRKFLSALGYFYAVSFAAGGAVYGFSALSSNLYGNSEYEVLLNLVTRTGNIVDVLLWGFPLALIFWSTMGRWGWRRLKRTLVQAVFRFQFSLLFEQTEVKLEGLVDTGNQLRDPLTKIPVVVVEAAVLLPYLPCGFEQQIYPDLDPENLQASLQGTHWDKRLRLIPFTSVGQQNGLMIGFIPDLLIIDTPGGKIHTKKVIIGLYAKTLSPDGAYRALLHPDLLPAA